MTHTPTLIIGIGNHYRGDDAFGRIVVRELDRQVPPGVTCIEHDGEPAGLMECWQDVERVILIDAVSSGVKPGQIFCFDLARQDLPEEFHLYSTHAFGVRQAVELARALGKLPQVIQFIGVEGENFDAGGELSAPLLKAKGAVVSEILNTLDMRASDHA